eukprot:gene7915-7332_t
MTNATRAETGYPGFAADLAASLGSLDRGRDVRTVVGEEFSDKAEKIRLAGPSGLHMVMDFDRTLTT